MRVGYIPTEAGSDLIEKAEKVVLNHLSTTRTARVERFPLIYMHRSIPMTLPPMWAAWSDGTGELIAKTTSRIMCMRAARMMRYEPRLFLRAGDKGGVRWKALARWFVYWIIAQAKEVWSDR